MNYQDTINQIFQQYLGRAPSPAEMQGFTAAMQNNILDPIGLTQFLQSTAQYQQQQIPQYAQAMQGQLQGLQQQSTADTLKQGYDQAVGRYAQMGRPDSSGLGSSFAQVAQQAAAQNAGQTAQQVGGYLGGAYGGLSQGQQGYGGNYAPAFGAYQGQQYNLQNMAEQNKYYQNYLSQNMRQANINNNYRLLGAGIGAAGTVGAAAMAFSDERLKENIEPTGRIKDLVVYKFNYKPVTGLTTIRQEGFLAQEVEEKYPHCVIEDKNGFKMINLLALLGSL